MATKKITQEDIKAGRIYRCGNCETKCGDSFNTTRCEMIAGRAVCKETLYYCDPACAFKYIRDQHIINYTADIKRLSKALEMLNKFMGGIIGAGRTSKSCFEAIKMTRLKLKCKTMLVGRETPRHIVEVELFKLSESAMKYAELVADKEDEGFNRHMNDYDEYTQIEAYNLAMWAREHCTDKTCLSMWFD